MSTSVPIKNPLGLSTGCHVQAKRGGPAMVITRVDGGIATCEVLDGTFPARKVKVSLDHLRVAD